MVRDGAGFGQMVNAALAGTRWLRRITQARSCVHARRRGVMVNGWLVKERYSDETETSRHTIGVVPAKAGIHTARSINCGR